MTCATWMQWRMVPWQASLLASLPSSFLFFPSLSCPPFLWRPSGPHQASFCSSHMWGVSAHPTRINQPVNAWTFVHVLTPPLSFSPSLPRLVVPHRRELAPFTVLPSPLEQTSQGLNSAILCLIAPAPLWRTASSKYLWRHRRKWTGFVLYKPNHMEESVRQAFNKRKGQNV